MSETVETYRFGMEDVYHDDPNVEPGEVDIYLSRDFQGSLILDPSPVIEGGDWNIIIENREGQTYLMVWHQDDYGNDPRLTMNLDEGVVESWSPTWPKVERPS